MERWRKTDLCIISSRAEALQAAGDAALEAQSVNMKINLVKKKKKKKAHAFQKCSTTREYLGEHESVFTGFLRYLARRCNMSY